MPRFNQTSALAFSDVLGFGLGLARCGLVNIPPGYFAGLDRPLCHCAVAQAPPPFDEHRRPLAPSNFFDNNGNDFS